MFETLAEHFVSSKVLSWVALDRGVRLAYQWGLPVDEEMPQSWVTLGKGIGQLPQCLYPPGLITAVLRLDWALG
jgi:hypothetical protein